MWDMIEILLDNCNFNSKNQSNEDGIPNKGYDFRVIDPFKFKDVNSHPLMMIANSGQEELLTHNTIVTLLELKWHKIPRIFYAFNLLIHFVFLILFTCYSIDLVDISKLPQNSNETQNI